MLKDIMILANMINKYIMDSFEKYMKRIRKVNILDAVLFRLLLSRNGAIQDNVTIDVNKFTGKTCRRSSYVDRENKLDVNFYKGINDIIDNYINKKIKNVTQVVAVDGTYINILNNIKEFKTNNNSEKQNITPLISGIYNVSYKFPVALDIVTHKNEIKAFREEYLNNNLYKNCIYVFDRGYQSNEFFKILHLSKIKYICRIKKNTKIINPTNVDTTILLNIDDVSFNVRNINYKINDTDYFIVSSLMDSETYSVDKIKQFYHNRWTVEEYFKYLKKYHNIENLNDKNIDKLCKSVYANLISSKLIFLLSSIVEKKIVKKVVKSQLVKGFYDEFIYKFIFKKGFDYRFMQEFMKTYVVLRTPDNDRTFPRTCKKTTGKWYRKQFVSKNKKNNNKQVENNINDNNINDKNIVGNKKNDNNDNINNNENKINNNKNKINNNENNNKKIKKNSDGKNKKNVN